MAATAMCDQVLQTLKYSNLNFVVQETPFFAYITSRKSFISGKISRSESSEVSSAPPVNNITEQNEVLETRVSELEVENENYANDLHNISLKLEKAKKELLNAMLEEETASHKHLEENVLEN